MMRRTLRTAFSRGLLLSAVLAFSACGPDPTPTPTPVTPDNRQWATVGQSLEVAALSVSGTAGDDVWAVGAEAGKGGVVLHFDGNTWTRMPSGQAYDLWWVTALAKNDVWIGGAGATILHWDGTAFTRMKTPGLAADTVYGIWAASANDVWAVGSHAGRYGFLWHWDGTAFTNVLLPDDVQLDASGELPGLFKVWGRNANDIYAVGGNGLMMHYDGKAWKVIPTETTETLFTVHGDANEIVAVGGSSNGVVVNGEGKLIGPEFAPLLQGVVKDSTGTTWLSGEKGVVYKRKAGGTWEAITTGLSQPQSLHAIWADPQGSVWTVGGNVLSTLDAGVIFRLADKTIATVDPLMPDPPPPAVCPAGRADILPTGSIARRWNELMLDSIRRDVPKPGVHARNLFHTSVAMYDAWAAYDAMADGYKFVEKKTAPDVDEARRVAISYASYRVLAHRYEKANGGPISLACYDAFMGVLGLDPKDTHTNGDDPIAVGNRIGQGVVDAFVDDGANEANAYGDTTNYLAVNQPLLVDRAGTVCAEPKHWQELNLAQAETQNGLIVPSGVQKYIGPNWGFVTSFALPPDANNDGVHHDVALVPDPNMPEMKNWVVEMIEKASVLDPNEKSTIDISPGAFGNNTLGTNDGKGYAQNPVTNAPYAPNVVPLGDFTRVLAEFWADGPKSETPPGHWNVVANFASDSPQLQHKLWGQGTVVDRLQWDVKLYLALNGAVHDAAITAWGIKRAYTTSRPITLVRYMAGKGQSSDPMAPSYDPGGIPLKPGVIELITDASSAPGERHYHLRYWKGQVAIRSWLGEPGDRKNEVGHVGWMRAVDWIPYQRRTFVTPAFPGLISGHSTFSRAAAEVLTMFTGSAYFPGGLGEYVAKKGEYLVFEDGPSVDVRLQWATYYDAADQAGQSRLWGGIHIWPDDGQGRQLGSIVGIDAANLAKKYFDGTAIP